MWHGGSPGEGVRHGERDGGSDAARRGEDKQEGARRTRAAAGAASSKASTTPSGQRRTVWSWRRAPRAERSPVDGTGQPRGTRGRMKTLNSHTSDCPPARSHDGPLWMSPATQRPRRACESVRDSREVARDSATPSLSELVRPWRTGTATALFSEAATTHGWF